MALYFVQTAACTSVCNFNVEFSTYPPRFNGSRYYSLSRIQGFILIITKNLFRSIRIIKQALNMSDSAKQQAIYGFCELEFRDLRAPINLKTFSFLTIIFSSCKQLVGGNTGNCYYGENSVPFTKPTFPIYVTWTMDSDSGLLRLILVPKSKIAQSHHGSYSFLAEEFLEPDLQFQRKVSQTSYRQT